MKVNHDKCHLLLSTLDQAGIQIANIIIISPSAKKILGITAENKLGFDKCLENVCKKRTRKLNAITRLANSMDLSKKFNPYE